jgi:hypothetical protein
MTLNMIWDMILDNIYLIIIGPSVVGRRRPPHWHEWNVLYCISNVLFLALVVCQEPSIVTRSVSLVLCSPLQCNWFIVW